MPSPPTSASRRRRASAGSGPCAPAGVIRGFHADIDPAALGRPLQAMIAVRLQAAARSRMMAFTDRIQKRPEVLDIYFLAGADDFLLHVAAADAARAARLRRRSALRLPGGGADRDQPDLRARPRRRAGRPDRQDGRRSSAVTVRRAAAYDSAMSTPDGLALAEDLMTKGGVHPTAIAVFAHSYRMLASGETGMLAEVGPGTDRGTPQIGRPAHRPGGCPASSPADRRGQAQRRPRHFDGHGPGEIAGRGALRQDVPGPHRRTDPQPAHRVRSGVAAAVHGQLPDPGRHPGRTRRPHRHFARRAAAGLPAEP